MVGAARGAPLAVRRVVRRRPRRRALPARAGAGPSHRRGARRRGDHRGRGAGPPGRWHDADRTGGALLRSRAAARRRDRASGSRRSPGPAVVPPRVLEGRRRRAGLPAVLRRGHPRRGAGGAARRVRRNPSDAPAPAGRGRDRRLPDRPSRRPLRSARLPARPRARHGRGVDRGGEDPRGRGAAARGLPLRRHHRLRRAVAGGRAVPRPARRDRADPSVAAPHRGPAPLRGGGRGVHGPDHLHQPVGGDRTAHHPDPSHLPGGHPAAGHHAAEHPEGGPRAPGGDGPLPRLHRAGRAGLRRRAGGDRAGRRAGTGPARRGRGPGDDPGDGGGAGVRRRGGQRGPHPQPRTGRGGGPLRADLRPRARQGSRGHGLLPLHPLPGGERGGGRPGPDRGRGRRAARSRPVDDPHPTGRDDHPVHP